MSGGGPVNFHFWQALHGVADAAHSLILSSKRRMDGIHPSVRMFPETIVSRVHLEMVFTLRACIWDLEDESKAVLMFKILSPFKILKKKASFTNKFCFFFSFHSFFFFLFSFFFFLFGFYLEEMGCFLWHKDRNLRPSWNTSERFLICKEPLLIAE